MRWNINQVHCVGALVKITLDRNISNFRLVCDLSFDQHTHTVPYQLTHRTPTAKAYHKSFESCCSLYHSHAVPRPAVVSPGPQGRIPWPSSLGVRERPPLLLVYEAEYARFRIVENGEDVGPHYVELEEVDFLVSSAVRKNVVIRYRDEVNLLPVRITLHSARNTAWNSWSSSRA